MRRLDALTLKQLRALAAIKRHGSITLAAEALNLTVPAVSTQLKLLEENVGAKLVIRDKEHGSSDLTRHGQVMLKAIENIESILAHSLKCTQALTDGKSGYLSFGVVSTGKYFAPQLVAMAKKAMPEIQIELSIGNRKTILSGLENGSLDLAIMGRPPRQPAVEAIGLGDHPHILIAPPDHPLVNNKNFSGEELLAQTFIKREVGSGTRILMERYLDRVGDGIVYDWMEFNTNETIKQAVIAGLGIALISEHTVIEELKSWRIATIDMQGLPIMRRWFVVRPAEVELTPVIERVQAFLVTEEKNYLPSFLQL